MYIVSVLITSDYYAGGERSWADERRCFRALARQDMAEPVEYILCEREGGGEVPADVVALLPGVRVERFALENSYALKNAGARLAAGEFVTILDTDCEPEPSWLRVAVEVLRSRPKLAGVSGVTRYPGDGLAVRVMALLSRAFLDPGGAEGETEHLANHCGVARRELFLRYPLPEDLGVFSARIQSEAMRRDGWKLWFDERILVTHGYEGWEMEGDIRRNSGWGTVATRLADGRLPYAWLVRMGPVAIPAIWAGKVWDAWVAAVRCRGRYGIGWHEMPAALGLAVVVVSREVPGMWRAYRREPLTETAYR